MSELLLTDVTEIGAFGQVPADQAIGILTGTPLPRGVGMRKIAAQAKAGSDLLMPSVLGAVVQGQGSPRIRRPALQSGNDGLRGGFSGLTIQPREQQQTGIALHQRVDGDAALARDQAVSFPVAELTTATDRGGPAVNGDAVGNLRAALPSAYAARLAVAMRPAQTADKLRTPFRPGMIDILVDRLMADAQIRVIYTDPAGNLLRRPAQGQLGLDIGEDSGLLQPRPAARVLAPRRRTALRPVR